MATVFTVAGAVAAGGVALVGLGFAISGLGAAMEVVTRLPAGDFIVFVLAILIAAAAFAARRWETRKLLPQQPETTPAAA